MTSITRTSSTFVAARAAGYQLQMGRGCRRLAAEFVDFVGVGDGERVLDVGCGTGSLARLSQRDEPQIHGVDLAAPYVEHAARTNGDPRLRFSVGDACALDFPDHAFDRVLSLLALDFGQRRSRRLQRCVASHGLERSSALRCGICGAAWLPARYSSIPPPPSIPPPTLTGAALDSTPHATG